VDHDEMRAFAFREEHGYLPDDVYTPTAEDDRFDPEQWEVQELVMQGYAATNRARRDEVYQRKLDALQALLTEHGIEVPE